MDNMLILSYEGICKDMRGTVQRVAKFINLEVSDEDVDRVTQRCSREYMLTDQFTVPFRDERAAKWTGTTGHFVRMPSNTGFHAFSFDELEKQASRRMLYETFQVSTYHELLENILPKEQDLDAERGTG